MRGTGQIGPYIATSAGLVDDVDAMAPSADSMVGIEVERRLGRARDEDGEREDADRDEDAVAAGREAQQGTPCR